MFRDFRTIIFLSVFFMLFSAAVQAAPVTEDLAMAVETRYAKRQSWSANLVQTTHIAVLKQELQKLATIQVARPDRIRIEYKSDPKKIYVSDGDKLWIYKNEDTTAWQFDDPEKVLSREALSFLGGFQNLSELFDVIPGLKEAEGYLQLKDKTLKRVALIPKDVNSDVIKITLGVEGKTKTVREAVLYNASGNVTHYAFDEIQFDQKIDPVVFSLPKEPKRKIIKK